MKRLLTSFCYVIFLTFFFVMKSVTSVSLWFDVPIYAFSLVGTHEILRAAESAEAGEEQGRKLPLFQKVAVWCFSVCYVPLYAVTEEFFGMGMIAMLFMILFFGLAIFLSFLLSYDETGIRSTGKALFSCFYPTVFLSFLCFLNHLPDFRLSCFAVFFLFIVSPCSDSFAYLFGKYLGRFFPKKMSPVISPKKTVVGCVGGLLGGAVFSVIAYLIYTLIYPDFSLFSSLGWDILFCAVVGFVGSVLSEVGDLIESAIKRKAGLKDSGNILPGHGGILDRIDSTLLTAVVVFIAFGMIMP